MPLRLGVLVSGRGTNLQAILDAIATGRLDAQVELVVSNRPQAPALTRARAAGIQTRIIDHREHADRESFDRAVAFTLREANVEWVVLAGFMRLLTQELLGAFPDRVINVHPSLLPAFPGIRAQKQALEYGVKVTGCSVHFVDSGTDTGPIIAQRAIEVLPSDDLESLEQRLLEVEHELLVEVLSWAAAERLELVQVAGSPERRQVRLS